jgi:hypothetical protein
MKIRIVRLTCVLFPSIRFGLLWRNIFALGVKNPFKEILLHNPTTSLYPPRR